MPADPTAVTYAGFALVALLVGFVKTGLPPLGILIPVAMAFALPTRESVGALLPFLIVGDVFAVLYYRRGADLAELRRLLPPVAAGVLLGALVLGAVDDGALRVVIGALVLAMVGLEVLRGSGRAPRVGGAVSRLVVGVAAGLATALANAAGPIMGIYLLASAADKQRFMGTMAVFFLVVNCSKVPVYVACDMLSWTWLGVFVLVSPLVVVGAVAGRRFLAWLPQEAFRRAVLVLTAVASVVLLASG